MSRATRRSPQRDESSNEAPQREPLQRERRRSRRKTGAWRRRALLAMAAAVAGVAGAPSIVCRTPLGGMTLQWAAAKAGLRLEAEQVRVGWLTPLSIQGARLTDADGGPLCEAESVSLDRTLLQLMRDQQDLGNLLLQQPRATVRLRENGSNWEDALKPLLEGDSSGSPPKLAVEVRQGSVQLQDDRNSRTWTLTPLQLTLGLQQSAATPVTGELTSRVSDGALEGGIALQVQSSGESLHADLKTQHLPLSLAEALAARLSPGLRAAGQLDSEMSLKWSHGQGELSVLGLTAQQLAIRPPGAGENEALQMRQLEIQGLLRSAQGRLQAEGLQAVSDVASFSLDADLTAGSLATLWQMALLPERDQVRLAGQVDLARLAEMFPQTLRIKDDTRIESGRLQVSLTSGQGAARQWAGKLSAVDIAAHGGRTPSEVGAAGSGRVSGIASRQSLGRSEPEMRIELFAHRRRRQPPGGSGGDSRRPRPTPPATRPTRGSSSTGNGGAVLGERELAASRRRNRQ